MQVVKKKKTIILHHRELILVWWLRHRGGNVFWNPLLETYCTIYFHCSDQVYELRRSSDRTQSLPLFAITYEQIWPSLYFVLFQTFIEFSNRNKIWILYQHFSAWIVSKMASSRWSYPDTVTLLRFCRLLPQVGHIVTDATEKKTTKMSLSPSSLKVVC